MNKEESKCILCKHYMVLPEHKQGRMCEDSEGQPAGPSSGAPICQIGNYFLPAHKISGVWIPDIVECAGFEGKEKFWWQCTCGNTCFDYYHSKFCDNCVTPTWSRYYK